MGCGRAPRGEICGRRGEEGVRDAGRGLNSELAMGAGPGGRSDAARSCPVATGACARATGECLADSDRSTARTWRAAAMAACSRCPSWGGFWGDGDGAAQKGARRDASRTRFQLAAPSSGREGSRGGGAGAGSGSLPDSWSATPAAGVGGEGAGGKGGAWGELLAGADRGRSSACTPQSCGRRAPLNPARGCAAGTRRDEGRSLRGSWSHGEGKSGCGGWQNAPQVRRPGDTQGTTSPCTSHSCCRS